MEEYDYGSAIRAAFDYLLKTYPEVFILGQGLWSPWYVGNSMTDLDKDYGKDRVIDTPVSESACTGAAVGASLSGMRSIVVHPRMDFMLYSMDAIVNQAAKWSHMFGGQAHPAVTIRGIINRGGEQGAQHSQALHSWFAHVPGLRVVMPCSVADARDLLIASVLCDDPVIFIDDRWLYSQKDVLMPVAEIKLEAVGPRRLSDGQDITIVGAGYSCLLAQRSALKLKRNGILADVIDLRVINPIDNQLIVESVNKTGRLLVVDGGWKTCGLGAEILAGVVEKIEPQLLKCRPARIALPDAPAPTSGVLESCYYPDEDMVVSTATKMIT